MVVELAPLLDQHSSFPQIPEPFPVQTFVPQLSVEAFNKAVLPGSARRNECRADPPVTKPAHHCSCGELSSLVGANVRGLAVKPHEPRQNENHILARERARNLQCEAFARVLIKHAKHSKRPPIGKAIMHEVVTPHAVRMRGTWQPDIRAATPAPRPSSWELEAELLPQPSYSTQTYIEPCRRSSISEARQLLRALDELLAKGFVLHGLTQLVARDTTAQTKIAARSALRHSPARHRLERLPPPSRVLIFFR